MICPACGSEWNEAEGKCPRCGYEGSGDAPREEGAPVEEDTGTASLPGSEMTGREEAENTAPPEPVRADALGPDGAPFADDMERDGRDTAPPDCAAQEGAAEEPDRYDELRPDAGPTDVYGASDAGPPPDDGWRPYDDAPPMGPERAMRRSRTPLIVALVALAVLVLLAFFLVPRIIRSLSPKMKVLDAFTETARVLQVEAKKTSDELGMDKIMEYARKNPSQQDFSVTLQQIPGLPFQNATVTTSLYTSLPERRMDLDIGVGMGVMQLAGIHIAAQDSILAASAPMFFDGWYGVDTVTIGEDYQRSALRELSGSELPREMSFNMFDLMAQAQDGTAQEYLSRETRKVMDEQHMVLLNAISVEKNGSADRDVNGFSKQCDAYRMALPKEALETWAYDMLETLMKDEWFRDLIRGNSSAFYSLDPYAFYGMEEFGEGDMLAEFEEDMRYMLEEMFASLVGDMTIDVFVNKGTVAALDILFPVEDYWEERYDAAVSLQLGGEKYLSDGLAVVVSAGDSNMEFSMSGTHVPQNGVVESRMSLRYTDFYYEEEQTAFTAHFRYDANGEADNFRMNIAVPDSYSPLEMNVTASVLADVSAHTLTMDMTSIEMITDYTSLYLSAAYRVMPLTAYRFEDVDATMLLEMSGAELEALASEIEGRISGQVGGLFGVAA